MNRATPATGWVRNPDGTLGWTWNPLSGCLNHTPEGLCLGGMFPCYAFRLANGRLRERYLANKNLPPFTPENIPYGEASQMYIQKCFNDPFFPRFWPERLEDIKPSGGWWDTLGGRQAKGIFVCDMGELFGDWLPSEWQKEVFDTIKSDPLDRFYILTKQPQNLVKFSPFPDNCWVGVSATDDFMFARAIEYLDQVEAVVKYISFEPLLGAIEATEWGPELFESINQVIIGAQSKPYKPPRIEWVREIVEAAGRAGTAVFLKDNLKPLLVKNRDGQEYAPLWANGGYGTLKQEVPNGR